MNSRWNCQVRQRVLIIPLLLWFLVRLCATAFYSSDLQQTASQTGSLPVHSPYVDLTEIMTSLCRNRSALQMGRATFAFMVFGQTSPACFSGIVQLGLRTWELLNWIRQDQWSIQCSNWDALASSSDWISLYFLKIIFLLTPSVDHIMTSSVKNLQSICFSLI